MALSVCEPIMINQQGRELTKHGTALFPAAFYHDRLSEAAVPWHWHDEIEVLFIETGTSHVSVNSVGLWHTVAVTVSPCPVCPFCPLFLFACTDSLVLLLSGCWSVLI